jgi:hypothetical protein
LHVKTCILEEEKTVARLRGRERVISIGDGDEPKYFGVVAGMRALTISLTAGLIEAESSGVA